MADATPSVPVQTTPATTSVPETPQAPPISSLPSPQGATTSSDPNTPAAPLLDQKTAEQTPAESAKPQGELFEIDLDGEKKSLSANELVDYTQEKIETAINIHDRYMEGLKGFAENPLKASLDAMAEIRFGGDKRAAYQELIKVCDQLLSEEHKYRQLPEPERKALEAEDRARAVQAELERIRNREAKESEKIRIRAQSDALIAEMNKAIKEAGLPDTREMKGEMIYYIKSRRALGEDPSFKDAATHFASRSSRWEEDSLKQLDEEKLKRVRPDLIEKLRLESLDQTRAAREEKASNGEKKLPIDFRPRRVPTSQILRR